MFRLRVYTPAGLVFDEDIDFLRGEDYTGTFGILSRHIDFITILKPAVVIVKKGGEEIYIAVKGGIFSFQDNQARISTPAAIEGKSLDSLHKLVQEKFKKETEKDRMLGETLKNMERDFLKRLIELEKGG